MDRLQTSELQLDRAKKHGGARVYISQPVNKLIYAYVHVVVQHIKKIPRTAADRAPLACYSSRSVSWWIL